MEIQHHALGIRFDTRKFPCGNAMTQAFELLYSVLSYTELNGVKVSGGFPYAEEPYIYLVVFESENYKGLKKIYALLQDDAALKLFLVDTVPYIERNRLQPLQNMTAYGSYDYVNYKLANAPQEVYGVKLQKKRGDIKGKGFRFMFAPDSFKDSMTASEAIRILALAVKNSRFRGCDIVPMPLADGGEGTLETICGVLNARYVNVTVHGPLGNLIEAQYAVINGDTALIEMAKASGLSLVPKEKRNARYTSSYGTGELIAHAIDSGIRKVVLALGGSATNDGGMGCAKALGIRYLDKFGKEVPYFGDGMIFVKSIDTSYLRLGVRDTKFTLICDVDNPLTGTNGATMVYGAQKGADEVTLLQLECGMKNLRRLYNNNVGSDICAKSGAGAAGGMGAMMMSLFGAKANCGIDTVLELTGFEKQLKSVSLIVTGEGSLDEQTFDGGKTVSGILKRTAGKVPVVVLSGSAQNKALMQLKDTGVLTAAHSFISEQEALSNAKELYYMAASNLFKLLGAGRKMRRK